MISHHSRYKYIAKPRLSIPHHAAVKKLAREGSSIDKIGVQWAVSRRAGGAGGAGREGGSLAQCAARGRHTRRAAPLYDAPARARYAPTLYDARAL
ncbi:unnamed protein product, partial [Iphiclides podalirius]